jgi:hypothetical protein
MTVWQSSPKQRFLKSVGSADDPMAADWMTSAPQEMTTIHFSKQPASIRVDDYLVYYAAVWQKVIGIVQLFTPAQLDAQLVRWQYWSTVRPKLMISDFERAPSIDVLTVDGGRDFRKVVMQMDYKILEDAEYERAHAALHAAVDVTKGDFLDPKFALPSSRRDVGGA